MEDNSGGRIILIDKPVGISSFGVVKKIRNFCGEKKVGHAGTLDPLASGLLIILIGSQTKNANQFLKMDKTYLVEAKLGQTSDTGDSEGEIKRVSNIQPNEQEIDKVLKSFVGEISQRPHTYSAIKVNGKRAYHLARQGKKLDLAPRDIKIYSLDKIKFSYPMLEFEAKVSSGTYIRSLVDDIGKRLKTGAYTTSLRRTKIGDYNISDSVLLDSLG